MFDDDRYFDVFAEYAKAEPDDILIRITVANRGPDAATLHLLPTLWFRNTWSWGREGEGYWPQAAASRARRPRHASPSTPCSARYRLDAEAPDGRPDPALLFTENETNVERLFGAPNAAALREGRLSSRT